MTDGRKHTTTREYDGSHRVIKETIAGHERKWSYGTKKRRSPNPTAPSPSVCSTPRTSRRRPSKPKGTGLERVTEYEYSGTTYDLTKLIDPNKHIIEYGYDEEGNRTSRKRPQRRRTQMEYDKKHDLVKETSPEGEVAKVKLTEAGLPEVLEQPAGAETQKIEFKYDTYWASPPKPQTRSATKPNTHTTVTATRKSKQTPKGNEQKWKYNEDSQETEETSPRANTTKTERNNYGLPTKVTDPLGHATEIKYDANQNIDSVTDGNKHATKYEYNTENLPIKVTEPNGDITETGYDAEGRKTSYTDGNSHTWEYKRNILEQVTEEKNPLGKIWKKIYSKAGNPKLVKTPRNRSLNTATTKPTGSQESNSPPANQSK